MNTMRHTSLRTLAAAALVALLGMATLTSAGGKTEVTKPFKITGGGVAPEGLRPPGEVTTHLIDGNATHLGHHTGVGNFDIFSLAPTSPTTLEGTFGSHDPCVFVAANGDELVCYYGRTDKGAEAVGTFTLTVVGVTDGGAPIVEALFIAEFVPQPESTGRFAGASGSWIMYAQTEPFVLGSDDPVAYAWEGEGTLTLPK
jgi:hypothetical protein